MEVELMGCTGAGKSTFAKNIVQACRARGIDISMGEEFVLKQAKLNWVKGKLTRTLLVDLCSALACLLTWQKNQQFYFFTFEVVYHLPATVSWFEKFNIVRNVLKKIGTHEIICRYANDHQLTLLDEGTLQAAHCLFVHVSAAMSPDDLATFVKLVPLPDIAIQVTQNEPMLIARTLERGHKRIPAQSPDQVACFINRAVEVFNQLVQQLVFERGISFLSVEQHIIMAPNYQANGMLHEFLKILGLE
jgi:hypothetical protein